MNNTSPPHDALSIVVATRARPAWLADVLVDLVAQIGSADEVLVVDQSEPADAARVSTMVAALADPRVRCVTAPPLGLPAARNVGIAATTCPLVLFIDDDVRLLPGCLAGHRGAFTDPRVGGVAGRIVERLAGPNARGAPTLRVAGSGRVITDLAGGDAGPIGAVKGANMSFRRQALAAAGGFDVGYAGTSLLEDADVARRVARAGYALWFAPDAGVVHLSAGAGGVRVDDHAATLTWRLHNTARFVRRHGSSADAVRFAAVHAGLAVFKAVRWRRPKLAAALLVAGVRGWREAG